MSTLLRTSAGVHARTRTLVISGALPLLSICTYLARTLRVHVSGTRFYILIRRAFVFRATCHIYSGINLRKIAELMPGASGAELKGVCTEAGAYTSNQRPCVPPLA